MEFLSEFGVAIFRGDLDPLTLDHVFRRFNFRHVFRVELRDKKVIANFGAGVSAAVENPDEETPKVINADVTTETVESASGKDKVANN